MPARILLATAGSYGDLFPTVGLAVGLAARGHHPIVATSPHYRSVVESEQVAFAPIRPDLDPFSPTILARAMDEWRGPEVVVRELVLPGLRDAYDDLVTAARGADLVLSHPITFAAPLVAARLGVPWLSTVLAPLSFFSIGDYPAVPPTVGLAPLTEGRPWVARLLPNVSRAATRHWTRPVSALRHELGLPPAGHPLFEGQFSPLGTLALYSAVLGRPQPDWPVHATVTGFVFYDRHGASPAELQQFVEAGDPPLVFTLGSSAVGAVGSTAFYAASLAAARALGRRAVLLVGPGGAWTDLTREPDWIAVAYAPHHRLLPQAAAVVHHGGIGTTGEALRSGRPALVVPHAHDQFDNARRVARIGTARVLDARRYTAARATEALDALLTDRAMAEAAAAVGQQVRAEGGVTTAVAAIEAALGRAS